MSLKALLEECFATAKKQVPPEAFEVITRVAADLSAQGIGRDALKAGEQLPDASLLNANGEPMAISSLLANGPLVINFYRGGWCPYCNLELRAYQELLDELQSLGGQLVAVSPEKPDSSLSTIEKNEIKFPVLTDQGNEFARALGIVFSLPDELRSVYTGFGLELPTLNANAGWTLPIPATFVVNATGEIVLSHVESDYTKRLEPSDALAAIRSCV